MTPFVPPALAPEEADVVLVTATDVEYAMVTDVWRQLFNVQNAPPSVPPSTGYALLGTIGGNQVVLVQQTRMGAQGEGAAYTTVENAILDWAPRAVVMVGIAYGLRGQLGDILVADTVRYIDQRKEDTDPATGAPRTLPRGDRVRVALPLLEAFKRATRCWAGYAQTAGWSPAAVKGGLLLAGDTLINNLAFRDAAASFEPEALGGEMEAEGVAGAAGKHGVPWIIVKAICDFADGNKDEDKDARQRQAAVNAARFVFHTLCNEQLSMPKSDDLLRWHPSAYDVSELDSPYLHLRSYSSSPADQARFAGRDSLIAEMVARIADPDAPCSHYFIVGASGSGKSSLLQAGLLPALHQHYEQAGRPLAAVKTPVITPGKAPLNSLARALGLPLAPGQAPAPAALLDRLRALTADGALLILAIDQFEELFTLQPEQGPALLTLLDQLPPFAELPVHIVVAMREVFLPSLAGHPQLQAAAHRPQLFRRMFQDEIRQAITRPLRASYPLKRIEPALLERLAADAVDEETYLPLLQVTLDTIWTTQKSLALGGSGYSGLGSAIDGHAEQVYARRWRSTSAPGSDRPPAEQQLLLGLLLDLVTVSDDSQSRRYGRVTRRLAELTLGDEQKQGLVRELVDARLLVSRRGDEGGPELISIIHETLLYRWARLGSEITEQSARLRRRARFEEQLRLWLAGGEQEKHLLQGNPLDEALALEQAGDIALREEEATAFLRASQERLRREQAAYSRKLIRRRNLALVAAGVASILFVVALIAAGIAQAAQIRAGNQAATAVAAQEEAELQAQVSDAQRLSAFALAQAATGDHELALLLAASAVEQDNSVVTRIALDNIRRRFGRVRHTLEGHTGLVYSAAYSPDGTRIVTASDDGTARVHLVSWPDLRLDVACRIGRPLYDDEIRVFAVARPFDPDLENRECPPRFSWQREP